MIQSATGAVSNGMGPAIRTGRSGLLSNQLRLRAVLAFDIAATVPRGSTITDATLRLHMLISAQPAGPQSVTLHCMLASWGEGASVATGGQGAPAQPGDATWIHRFSPNLLWSSPGGDARIEPSASIIIDDVPGTYQWSSPELIADVQQWLDDPAGNFGWMLRTNEESAYTARSFASREHRDPGAHPTLIVTFKAPALSCPADITPIGEPDGVVNVDDLLEVISSWGPCAPDAGGCAADIAPPGAPPGNHIVNVDDLLLVIQRFGPCP